MGLMTATRAGWPGRRIGDLVWGLGVPVAMPLVAAMVLVGCGRSGGQGQPGAGAGTSIAAAVVAFVAPRDGADAVIGSELAQFAQSARFKVLGDCMTSDGFPAPTFPEGGPPSDLGNPQFPNLPVIEATHDLGLFTGGGVFFGLGPQGGMSAAERRAWQARIGHCFRATRGQSPLLGSARFGRLSLGWFNVVNQVARSKRIRGLNKKAAVCSAAHGVPATSVMSVYARLQGQLGPVSSASADSAKVRALQAKGAAVLAACWGNVIDETTALLSVRRASFLTQHASAIAALESQVNREVTQLGRRYGLKLAPVGS